jgi:hypothetical protein
MFAPAIRQRLCWLILFLVPLPQFQPMPLGRSREPFSHPEWLFEIKWDGFRSLVYIHKGKCRLISRNGNEFKSFPALAAHRSLQQNGAMVALPATGYRVRMLPVHFFFAGADFPLALLGDAAALLPSIASAGVSFSQLAALVPISNIGCSLLHANHGRGVSLFGCGLGIWIRTLAGTFNALPSRMPSPGANIGSCSSSSRDPVGRILLKYSMSSGF